MHICLALGYLHILTLSGKRGISRQRDNANFQMSTVTRDREYRFFFVSDRTSCTKKRRTRIGTETTDTSSSSARDNPTQQQSRRFQRQHGQRRLLLLDGVRQLQVLRLMPDDPSFVAVPWTCSNISTHLPCIFLFSEKYGLLFFCFLYSLALCVYPFLWLLLFNDVVCECNGFPERTELALECKPSVMQ